MTLFEKMWHLLPDRCQMPDCERHGVRGNEKIVDGLRMCNECATKRVQRDIERTAIDFERRLSLGDASRGRYGFFVDEIVKHDELRMKARLVCLDALEAQCKSTFETDTVAIMAATDALEARCKSETNTVAILAAIQAEREAIAAARRSRCVIDDPTSRS
jgi:hypothetical protein